MKSNILLSLLLSGLMMLLVTACTSGSMKSDSMHDEMSQDSMGMTHDDAMDTMQQPKMMIDKGEM